MHFLATNSHSDINKHCRLYHHPSGFSASKRAVYVMCLQFPISQYPAAAIPTLSSSQRQLLRCTCVATETALLLCTFPVYHSADKLLLATPQMQAGDKVWETTKSSYCPENSDGTSGNSAVWFHFGSCGFNYTLQKDTAISICMKCHTQPFTRCLTTARRETWFREWDTREEGGHASAIAK